MSEIEILFVIFGVAVIISIFGLISFIISLKNNSQISRLQVRIDELSQKIVKLNQNQTPAQNIPAVEANVSCEVTPKQTQTSAFSQTVSLPIENISITSDSNLSIKNIQTENPPAEIKNFININENINLAKKVYRVNQNPENKSWDQILVEKIRGWVYQKPFFESIDNSKFNSQVQKDDPVSSPPKKVVDKSWVDIFRDNWIVITGLLVLFLGFSFVVTVITPIIPREIRIAGVAIAAIIGLVIGFLIRHRRPSVALPLQGTAIAVFIMSIFIAYKNYHLISQLFTFGILIATMLIMSALADIQRSRSLAFMGVMLGFCIPILVSTGGGSLQSLFSYYALLHIGVIYLSTRRAWTLLNICSFGFLLIIATYWGVNRYHKGEFWQAQFFISFYFLVYFGLLIQGVLLKNPKNLVNPKNEFFAKLKLPLFYGALIFILPTALFLFEFGLWQNDRLLALILMLYAAIYLISAKLLINREKNIPYKNRLLAEFINSLILIGLVLSISAIPRAFSISFTTAIWTLSGVGIMYFSIQQKNSINVALGIILQVGAGIAFLRGGSLFESGIEIFSNINNNFTLKNAFYNGLFQGENPILWLIAAVVVTVIYHQFFSFSRPIDQQNIAQSNNLKENFAAENTAGVLINSLFVIFSIALIFVVVPNIYSSLMWNEFSFGFIKIIIPTVLVVIGFYMFYQNSSGEEKQPASSYWVIIPALILSYLAFTKEVDTYQTNIYHGLQALILSISSLGSAYLLYRFKNLQIALNEKPPTSFFTGIINYGQPFLLALGIFWLFRDLYIFIVNNLSISILINLPVYAIVLICILCLINYFAKKLKWQKLGDYVYLGWAFLANWLIAQIFWLWFFPEITTSDTSFTQYFNIFLMAIFSEIFYVCYRNKSSEAVANNKSTRRFFHHLYHGFWRIGLIILIISVVAVYSDLYLQSAVGLEANNSYRYGLFDSILPQINPSYWSWSLIIWVFILIIIWLFRPLKTAKENIYQNNDNGINKYLVAFSKNSGFPTAPINHWYVEVVLPIFISILILATIYRNLITEPTMAPISFYPIFNLIDLTSLISIFVSYILAKRFEGNNRLIIGFSQIYKYILMLIGIGAFVWMTMFTVRVCANYGDVPWHFSDIIYSSLIQPIITVVWTITAFSLMFYSSSHKNRFIWKVGVSLLLLIIVKLFILDLSQLSIIGYTFSFIGVGLMMVVIGYFSPIPPTIPIQNNSSEVK